LGTVRCSVTGRDWLLDGAAVARTDGLADSCQSLPARSPGATQAGSEPLASRAWAGCSASSHWHCSLAGC